MNASATISAVATASSGAAADRPTTAKMPWSWAQRQASSRFETASTHASIDRVASIAFRLDHHEAVVLESVGEFGSEVDESPTRGRSFEVQAEHGLVPRRSATVPAVRSPEGDRGLPPTSRPRTRGIRWFAVGAFVLGS